MDKKKLVTLAIAGLAVSGAAEASKTRAGETLCKGVALKYTNQCGANGHGCGGKAKTNFDKNEWIKLKTEDCKAVKEALKNPAVKAYVEQMQEATVSAAKRGKKF